MAEAVHTALPERFGASLAGSHPARGAMRLELAIPSRARVDMAVYDVRGALVQVLARDEFEPGRHLIRWDGLDVAGRPAASGMYFVRAVSRGQVVKLRLALIR